MKIFYFALSAMFLMSTFVYAEPDTREDCRKVKNRKFPPPNKTVGGQEALDDLGYFNMLADPKNPKYDLDLALKWVCESEFSTSENSMAEVILEIDKQKKK